MRYHTGCPAGPARRPQPLSASARSAGCAVNTLFAELFCGRGETERDMGNQGGGRKEVTRQDVLAPILPCSGPRARETPGHLHPESRPPVDLVQERPGPPPAPPWPGFPSTGLIACWVLL